MAMNVLDRMVLTTPVAASLDRHLKKKLCWLVLTLRDSQLMPSCRSLSRSGSEDRLVKSIKPMDGSYLALDIAHHMHRVPFAE